MLQQTESVCPLKHRAMQPQAKNEECALLSMLERTCSAVCSNSSREGLYEMLGCAYIHTRNV